MKYFQLAYILPNGLFATAAISSNPMEWIDKKMSENPGTILMGSCEISEEEFRTLMWRGYL